MLKLYIHTGNGHYVGSSVIVVSDNYETAASIIRNELNEMGLGDEELSIIEKEIVNNKIVFSRSGDY
jgi:hypothetical protein